MVNPPTWPTMHQRGCYWKRSKNPLRQRETTGEFIKRVCVGVKPLDRDGWMLLDAQSEPLEFVPDDLLVPRSEEYIFVHKSAFPKALYDEHA